MSSFNIKTIIKEDGATIRTSEATYDSPVIAKIDGETIPDASTDLQLPFGVLNSIKQFVFLESSQDLTVETNDGTTPQETISLIANIPRIWHDGETPDIFSGDVTDLFLTNASGSDAILYAFCGQDNT